MLWRSMRVDVRLFFAELDDSLTLWICDSVFLYLDISPTAALVSCLV